jgi:hypothetical protein
MCVVPDTVHTVIYCISKIIHEELTGFQMVKNSPHFIESEGSLPQSQVPATCPYPEPTRYSPCPHNFHLNSEPALYSLLTFHVLNLMPNFYSTKLSVQV